MTGEPAAPVVSVRADNVAGDSEDRLARRLFLVLAGIAVVYAFLAALHTLSDPDLGWQMATGRWIVQHHRIPSTDVFSYTAAGAPWIYPVAAEVFFYGVYLLGGYALLSWLGAIVCAGTIALLLRRGSAVTAAIAIVAIPAIAERTVPRAEMFTVLLFAAYLSLLWEHHQTGRARLLWLPLLMIAWVNLHLGFIAGLALIAGFVALEIFEMLLGQAKRRAALERLKRALPWYAATAAVTLVNPWGWNLYQALVRQNRAMAEHSQFIAEWASAQWNWHGGSMGTFLQQPMQYTLALLTVIVVVAALAAVIQGRPGETILLMGALWATMRYVRMEALTACVVVVIGGAVLTAAARQIAGRIPKVRTRSALAIAATVALAALAVVRAYQFTSDRVYLPLRSNFGAGLSWWFPQGAAEFVEREQLPGQIFNSFNEGGYIVWKLGERYQDYMDGRTVPFGPGAFEREKELLGSPLDSPRWQQEAEKYNINTILVQLDSEEVAFDQLQDLCTSENWRPVYLDEISMVLLRRTPQTQGLIDKLQITCALVPLPATTLDGSTRSFQRWLNAAHILLALRRTHDALTAADDAVEIFPGSSGAHWVRGNILDATHRRAEAEQEWLTSLAITPGGADPVVWSRLAELYAQQDRVPDAMHAWQQAVAFTADRALKARALVQLARLELITGHPREALQALDDAEREAPPAILAAKTGRSFSFDVAQGRAASSRRLGDLPRAVSYQEQAVQLDPDAADAWSYLAKLYEQQGRAEDQRRAEEQAKALAEAP
jgi:tetratricopeptide (TPR) repeat protein